MRAAETFARGDIGTHPRRRSSLVAPYPAPTVRVSSTNNSTNDNNNDNNSTKTSGSWIAREDTSSSASASRTPYASDPSDASDASDAPTSAANSTRRTVLLGVAAQLALLCAVASVLEGLVSLAPLGQLVANAAGDELLSAARAVPALVALQLLLDKTKSSYLLALQLLVVAKLHVRVMFPLQIGKSVVAASIGTQQQSQSQSPSPSQFSGVATVALAALMLAYPQLRFERHVAANPWVVALLLFTLAASAVLASADAALASVGAHLLLFNCGFLACTTFVLAALMGSDADNTSNSNDIGSSYATDVDDNDEYDSDVSTSSLGLSIKSAAFAFGVAAILASCVRERVGVSPSAFATSLAAQLALSLLASAELCGGRQHFEEEDGDVVFVEDACANGSVFRFIDMLVVFTTAASGLALLCLVLKCVL